jgi:hypothetical protein
MIRIIVGIVCVLAAASPAGAELTAASIAGRWQGENLGFARAPESCADGACTLTLDIVRCGEGWCGILIGRDNACGETALKLEVGKGEADAPSFKGTLALARGTEPYVIEANLVPASDGAPVILQLTGDTGGEFRAFRRSFPFQADLARASDAVCRLPQTVSLAE